LTIFLKPLRIKEGRDGNQDGGRAMSVVMECSRPLEELVDAKYAKNKRHGPAKRMLDSLVWASENLLLCVAREKDADGAETVKVRPELAATAPPTMAALTFLQAC
jgi:hypothetical protein